MDNKIITPDNINNNENKIINKILIDISKELLIDKQNIKVLLRNLYAILILLEISPESFFESLKNQDKIKDYEKRIKEIALESEDKK